MLVCCPLLTKPQRRRRSIREYQETRSKTLANTEQRHDLESYLLNRSTAATTEIFKALLALPTTKSDLGPLVHLPPSTTRLPREKPLPKPKPLTRWEKFAKMKGISHVKKDKNIWDDDRQAWVPRYGRDGKNRETEEAWIRVVKPGKEDEDPILVARNERKDRIAKNKRQQERNAADATAQLAVGASKAPREPVSTLSQAQKKSLRDARKQELERSLLVSKAATASMGKFDDKIEGEPKVKGVKRKVSLPLLCQGTVTDLRFSSHLLLPPHMPGKRTPNSTSSTRSAQPPPKRPRSTGPRRVSRATSIPERRCVSRREWTGRRVGVPVAVGEVGVEEVAAVGVVAQDVVDGAVAAARNRERFLHTDGFWTSIESGLNESTVFSIWCCIVLYIIFVPASIPRPWSQSSQCPHSIPYAAALVERSTSRTINRGKEITETPTD